MITSYANEVWNLIEWKMIEDVLAHASNSDKNVWEYLNNLAKDENSRIYKIIRDFHQEQSWTEKALTWLGRFFSYWMLVANPKLLIQNALTSFAYWLWKALTNIVSWKTAIDKNFVKDFWEVSDYLFNAWYLSHKWNDPDLKILIWDASTPKKLIWNFNKYLKDKPLQISTALGVTFSKVINSLAYMKSVVKKAEKDTWITQEKWESFSDYFTRVKNSLPIEQRIKIEAELSKNSTDIENNTRFNKWWLWIFDNPLMNMYKSWTRWDLTKTLDSLENIVDILVTDWPKWFKNVKGDLFNSFVNVALSWWALYYIAQAIWWTMYDTQEEIDEFTKNMVGESLKDMWLNKITSWFWMNADIVWNKLLDLWTQILLLKEATTKEDYLRILTKLWKTYFSWLTNWLKWSWLLWEVLNYWWNFKYKPETFTWPQFLWVSKESAQYNKIITGLKNKEKEYQKLDPGYVPFISDFIADVIWADFFKRVTDFNLTNPIYQFKVQKVLDNIKNTEWQKYSLSDFIDKAYEWVIPTNTETFEVFKKDLTDSLLKWYKSNYTKVNSMAKVISDIKWLKNINYSEDNFNETLNQLKVKYPQLYAEFYQNLFWLWLNWSTAQDNFTKNIIASELWWVRLANDITTNIEKVLNADQNAIKRNWKLPTEYDKLKLLDSMLWDLDNFQELKRQVYSAFPTLINQDITNENYWGIKDAIKDFPNIKDLYLTALDYRGALLKEQAIDTSWKLDTIPAANLNLDTNKTSNLWLGNFSNVTVPTWLSIDEKKKKKLSDLIKVPKSQPKVQRLFEKNNQISESLLSDLILKKN